MLFEINWYIWFLIQRLHHLFFRNCLFENCQGFRPSSDVVLLPWRTKLQFGSTVARQEINSDSDVVPESNQIQGLLEPRNNSPPHSPRERNLARTYKHNSVYEFSLARQKHDVWIAAVPESCSTAQLVELNCLPNLIQKFDSDAVLLPCFCRTKFLNLVRHGRSTTSELGLRNTFSNASHKLSYVQGAENLLKMFEFESRNSRHYSPWETLEISLTSFLAELSCFRPPFWKLRPPKQPHDALRHLTWPNLPRNLGTGNPWILWNDKHQPRSQGLSTRLMDKHLETISKCTSAIPVRMCNDFSGT